MKRLVLVTLLMLAGNAPLADSAGIRGAVADVDTDEDFQAYELFAVFDLPWTWGDPDSGVLTQLEVSGGVLDAADETGFVAAIVPRLAFVSGNVALDIGVGVAALGETEFGNHDFGGSGQFVAQTGLVVSVTPRFNIGLRYKHMSDGDTHENGEDLNLVLVEMSYAFNE